MFPNPYLTSQLVRDYQREMLTAGARQRQLSQHGHPAAGRLAAVRVIVRRLTTALAGAGPAAAGHAAPARSGPATSRRTCS